MNAADIIDLAGKHGVTLTAEAKRIIARPSHKLTPELRDAIRKHGAELLKALTHDKRAAKPDQETDSPKAAADGGRALSDLPQGTRQDDRRITPSNTNAQAGAHAGHQVIADPVKPCPAYDSQAKRREVLRMLAENPGITHAIISDDETDPEFVIITLAIRGQATCDLRIPKARYDGLKVLDLIEQHTNH
jgi:hypothetical protein